MVNTILEPLDYECPNRKHIPPEWFKRRDANETTRYQIWKCEHIQGRNKDVGVPRDQQLPSLELQPQWEEMALLYHSGSWSMESGLLSKSCNQGKMQLLADTQSTQRAMRRKEPPPLLPSLLLPTLPSHQLGRKPGWVRGRAQPPQSDSRESRVKKGCRWRRETTTGTNISLLTLTSPPGLKHWLLR